MEFLKALEDATRLGVTKEDFIKIWECEMKLKYQKDEAKVLELRLACSELSEPAQLLLVGDQMKSLLENYQKEMHQQIKELKDGLLLQSKNLFHEVSNLVENKSTMLTLIVKNELINSFDKFASKMNNEIEKSVLNVYNKSNQPLSAGNALIAHHLSDGLYQQNPEPEQTSSDSEENNLDYFPSDGAILVIGNIDDVVASGSVQYSPMYVLTDCPCKVRLSVRFNSSENIKVQLLVSGVTEQALKACRIFTVDGDIQNRNSGSYSELFEGISQPLRKLKPNKEVTVNAAVCLKTGSGSYDEVVFDELDKRGFVINDTCIIKWFVTSEEV